VEDGGVLLTLPRKGVVENADTALVLVADDGSMNSTTHCLRKNKSVNTQKRAAVVDPTLFLILIIILAVVPWSIA